MGYITHYRGDLTQPANVPLQKAPFIQPEVEFHYYCDQCGSWDVVSIQVHPEIETALGCAKYTALGLLLGGIAFWPLWVLAGVFVIAIVVYDKKRKSQKTDFHRCNQCGLVWDQHALHDPNPRGYRYSDYVSSW